MTDYAFIAHEDPDSSETYGFDWELRLGDEVILESEWLIERVAGQGEVTVSEEATGSTITWIKLTGNGTPCQYGAENRVTTSGGRILVRSFKVVLAQR